MTFYCFMACTLPPPAPGVKTQCSHNFTLLTIIYFVFLQQNFKKELNHRNIFSYQKSCGSCNTSVELRSMELNDPKDEMDIEKGSETDEDKESTKQLILHRDSFEGDKH